MILAAIRRWRIRRLEARIQACAKAALVANGRGDFDGFRTFLADVRTAQEQLSLLEQPHACHCTHDCTQGRRCPAR